MRPNGYLLVLLAGLLGVVDVVPNGLTAEIHYLMDYLTLGFLLGIAFSVGRSHQRLKELCEWRVGIETRLRRLEGIE